MNPASRHIFPGILTCFLSLCLLPLCQAQSESTFQTSPVEISQIIDTVAGKTYRVHTVQKGHTLYSISKKYGVPASDILKDSPDNQVQVGEFLYIPVTDPKTLSDPSLTYFSGKRPWAVVFLKNGENSENAAEKSSGVIDMSAPSPSKADKREERKDAREIRQAAKAEAKADASDIEADKSDFLSDAERDLVTADSSTQAASFPRIKRERKKPKDSLRISLLLPLYSTQEESRRSYVYLPFLEGASLAWLEYGQPDFFDSSSDSLDREQLPSPASAHERNAGVQHKRSAKNTDPCLSLKVFDLTESSRSLDEITEDPYFISSDVVVAGAFVHQFDLIDKVCREHRIPLIHPLSERDSMAIGNPYFIQLPANHTHQLEAVAELIRERGVSREVLIISDSSAAERQKALKLQELIPESRYMLFNSKTENYLKTLGDTATLTIIPFYQKEISAVKTVLQLRQSKENICLIAPSVWLEYTTIDIDYYLKNNLIVYTPFFRSGQDEDFIAFSKKYFLIYNGLPALMAYQGYLCFQWLCRMLQSHNADFMQYIGKGQEDASPFLFEERELSGGFENADVQFFELKPSGLEEIFLQNGF